MIPVDKSPFLSYIWDLNRNSTDPPGNTLSYLRNSHQSLVSCWISKSVDKGIGKGDPETRTNRLWREFIMQEMIKTGGKDKERCVSPSSKSTKKIKIRKRCSWPVLESCSSTGATFFFLLAPGSIDSFQVRTCSWDVGAAEKKRKKNLLQRLLRFQHVFPFFNAAIIKMKKRILAAYNYQILRNYYMPGIGSWDKRVHIFFLYVCSLNAFSWAYRCWRETVYELARQQPPQRFARFHLQMIS